MNSIALVINIILRIEKEKFEILEHLPLTRKEDNTQEQINLEAQVEQNRPPR